MRIGLNFMRSAAALWIGAALIASPGWAASMPNTFHGELSSVAHTLATRANVLGKGAVTANLADRKLTVSGSYSGLPSDATKAHLAVGLATGTPGIAFADLAVTGGIRGALSGSVALTSAQLAALRAGGVSIVIDSVKAPEGNLWGWLLPDAKAP